MADATPARGGPGQQDLTRGPIARTLFGFALPTLGSNILQSLNGSINAVWVGRFLGEGALAGTSSANLIMFMTFAASFGFGMAATILIGQRQGAGEIAAVRRTGGTAVGLFTCLSIAVSAVGWIAAPSLLRLLSTPAPAYPFALAYLRVIFVAQPPMMLVVLISMALRGVGDSVTPFRFMLLGVVLDAGLNPLLILGIGPFPRMGIAGAATATLIANVVLLVGIIAYIYWRDLSIRLRGAELRYLLPDPAILRVILVKGLPMGAQLLVMTLSGIILTGLVNRAGVDTAAAYGATQQLWTYAQMPAVAIGAAVSAMAAQNIGAGRWDRIDPITRTGLLANFVMTGGVVALILLFDRPALSLFLGPHSPAIPIARHIQLLASWNLIMFGMTSVLFATVRANGAVGWPLLILAAGLLVVRIPFAWALLPRFGNDVIWWSFPLGSGASLVLALLHYRFGAWRSGQLAPPVCDDEAREKALADSEPGGRLNPAG